MIPTATFFDTAKYSSLTLSDAIKYSIGKNVRSIANDDDDDDDDHVFYVADDNKLYILKSVEIGELDSLLFLNYSVLSAAAIEDVHAA